MNDLEPFPPNARPGLQQPIYGLLEELAAAGVRIDRFGGVSLCALVAASAAMGQSSDGGYEMFARSLTGTRPAAGSEHEIPHVGETILRTPTVGSIDTVAAARQRTDLVISPRVEGVGLLDDGRPAQVREPGRESPRATLEAGLAPALRV